MAIVLGVVLTLVVLAIAAPIAGYMAGTVSRHGPSVHGADQVQIPSSPPETLLGQRANPLGLQKNGPWRDITSKAKAASSVAFGSVYGVYPPVEGPSTQTFLVVGAELNGGISDIPGELRHQISGAEAAGASFPGAKIASLPVQTSVLNGQVACMSVTTANGAFGECLWMNAIAVITVGTFTNDLPTVNSMTQQVVMQLHSPSASV